MAATSLKLSIENRDNLPDGGPLDTVVSGRKGIDIGRDQHLDWSLPDPARVVSGKHCEIRYRDGDYWLTDVSTNGTFINGASGRAQGPHRLCDGDRLEIGHYVIAVSVEYEASDAPESFQPIAAPRPSDPWAGFGGSERSNGYDLDTSTPKPTWTPPPTGVDALDWAAELPMPETPAVVDDWVKGAVSRNVAPAPVVAPPASPDSPPAAAAPVVAPRSGPPSVEQFVATPSAPFAIPAPLFPGPTEQQPAAAVPAEQPPMPDMAMFIALLARGAGVPQDVLMQQKPEAVALMLGTILKVCLDEVRALLTARTETKGLVRSTNQTMIQAFENNPLKFSPSTEEALRKIMEAGNRSYLRGDEALRQSFHDIKTHQINTYAAMQQAIQHLVEDFAPTTIEKSIEKESGLGAMISNHKARLWDAYTLKWNAKASRYDNGLLDVFMLYFSECYDRMNQKNK